MSMGRVPERREADEAKAKRVPRSKKAREKGESPMQTFSGTANGTKSLRFYFFQFFSRFPVFSRISSFFSKICVKISRKKSHPLR